MSVVGVSRSGALTADLPGPSADLIMKVTSGRTFVMTDLIVNAVVFSSTLANLAEVMLADAVTSGGTAIGATEHKLRFHLPVVAFSDATVVNNPLVMTNIQNGPEFATAVSAAIFTGSADFLSHGIWVGGVER